MRLPESWVWDFWLLDDGERYHVFFLFASRALKEPNARHYRASIGHAVSDDLTNWERVPDVMVRSDAPAWDDLATWTGSVVRHPDGRWFMFYTGSTLAPGGSNIQRIGYATSDDLMSWDKVGHFVLEADPKWYERFGAGLWHDEAFRDPWVFADPDGDGWHMLITARANHGAGGPDDGVDRGVVGHAWSPDLERWEHRGPLTSPGEGFGQIEVVQTQEIDGRHVLMFSTGAEHIYGERAGEATSGVWYARAESALGPFDLANAQRIGGKELYVGKLIRDRDTGETKFLAFVTDVDGEFVGEIIDPMTVEWDGDGLVLRA
ncbi:family 43 glycosylhydrolase [Nocardioides cavernaquae]|uniref:family 43 glycosylhydrolase n=1 Tax=Nocardioides cavernaquae TaxID=2321396 RepID=UPI001C7DB9A3|nr:family 43 glycosylhydrolase [Nocardioides cavernaquae]